jgi:hypothetical protein
VHDLKFVDKQGGPTILSGTITQEDAPDSLVTSVPLYAAVGGRNVYLGRVFAEGRQTFFHIPVPRQARKILIDPEHSLLSRN